MLIPLPSPTPAHLHLLRKPYEELLTNSWMHKHTRGVRARTHIYTRKNKETLVSPRENKELLPWRGESLLKPLNWSYLQVSVKVPRCCFFFLKLGVKSQVFLQHFTLQHHSQWMVGRGAESRLFQASITRFSQPLLLPRNSAGFLGVCMHRIAPRVGEGLTGGLTASTWPLP